VLLNIMKKSSAGVSPLCTGVTPGSINKWQGGLFTIAHESASLCRGCPMHCTETKWSNKPTCSPID